MGYWRIERSSPPIRSTLPQMLDWTRPSTCMKKYFAYMRVSTVKQGEKGSSLQEQRDAIAAYARKHSLAISQWFEEKETAAKSGRPIFSKMLKELRRGAAAGVVTHKIDRSARNLRDWAMLGELVDTGVELHFAHESLDLTSRGGRLAADIQAVVAADYIRNLRDEVRKGFYGRIKQGLYPLQAPLGYVDNGGGKPKSIDPYRGPLVRHAFERYATGGTPLRVLVEELYAMGLRTRRGGKVTANVLATVLGNPFYVGLIRLRKAQDIFAGIHEPLISKSLFDAAQAIRTRRAPHKATVHRFRYQRMLTCGYCQKSLSASRAKGHIYYRCHTVTCPTTCLREEKVDMVLREASARFQLREEDWVMVKADVDFLLRSMGDAVDQANKGIDLSIAAIESRLERLTDAYVDQTVDKETYLPRKAGLLEERAALLSRKAYLRDRPDAVQHRATSLFELAKSLGNMPDLENDGRLRETLKSATSNLVVGGKDVVIAWERPFVEFGGDRSVQLGAPNRGKLRTKIADAIVRFARDEQHIDDSTSRA